MATQILFYATILCLSLATILCLSLLATLFFFKVKSTETISFNFTKFGSDQNLIFQGGAFTKDGKLTLTHAAWNTVGRVLYPAPIHIWDSKTDNVADFTTSFTFVIDGNGITSEYAEGLAFFIAPVDTQSGNYGGYLGVFNREGYNKTIQTVAVEFDTFQNLPWDPSYGHIGIDVNSIRSVSTAPWILQAWVEANVVISFTAATNALNVSLTYPNSVGYTLRDVVPLKDIVREWVRVGFSASTGRGRAIAEHEVLSWSFHSRLS